MKILIACGVDSIGQGGAPKSSLDLARALTDKGNQVLLAGDYSSSSTEMELITQNKINYQSMSMTGFISFPWLSLIKTIIIFKPDIIISTHRGCDINMFFLSRLFKKKIISIVRMVLSSGGDEKLKTEKLRNRLWYYVLRHSDKIIAISEFVRKDIIKTIKADSDKVVTIHNAVDIHYYKPVSSNQIMQAGKNFKIQKDIPLIILCGRLFYVKKPEKLLLIADKLKNEKLNFGYAGSGEMQDFLKSEVKRMGLQNKVLFFGNVNNMNLLYNCATALIHFREDEAFGRIVVEANACDKPVICVNRAGLSELVKNETNGLLFEPDDFNKIAEFIKKLINDKKYYKKLCQGNRQLVINNYSIEVLGNNYQQVVDSLSA